MSLKVGTNVSAMAASHSIDRANRKVETAFKSLATGKRIVNAGDDAAGFAIGETLRAQRSGLNQSRLNADNAISLIQVAEGGLNEQNNILIRLRELAVQAASDTVDNVERSFIQTEFEQLVSEFDRIAKSTQYGSTKLLSGDAREFEFQLGANSGAENVVSFNLDVDTTASEFDLDSLGIAEKSEARSALQNLDESIVDIAGVRANFGAIQSRLMSARDNIENQMENIAQAHSRIVDADVAKQTAKLVQGQVQQKFAVSVLAQANQSAMNAIKLIA